METNYSEPFIAVISAELMVFSCYQPIIYLKSRSKKKIVNTILVERYKFTFRNESIFLSVTTLSGSSLSFTEIVG
jgi:hypothetical protein